MMEANEDLARAARIWGMSLEIWGASGFVIARRTAMMAEAMVAPNAENMGELERLVPEKLGVTAEMLHAASGAKSPLEAIECALTPIHQQVRANARRLS